MEASSSTSPPSIVNSVYRYSFLKSLYWGVSVFCFVGVGLQKRVYKVEFYATKPNDAGGPVWISKNWIDSGIEHINIDAGGVCSVGVFQKCVY